MGELLSSTCPEPAEVRTLTMTGNCHLRQHRVPGAIHPVLHEAGEARGQARREELARLAAGRGPSQRPLNIPLPAVAGDGIAVSLTAIASSD